MNQKSFLMKNEIQVISRYRGLMVSKYYFIIILSLITLYLSIVRLAPSSLYILFVLVFLTPLLKFMAKDYSTKLKNNFLVEITKSETFILNNLKTKYKYSKLNYITNSVSYFVTVLLICLWQINYSLSLVADKALTKMPLLILIIGLTLRFLAVIVYRIKLPRDLLYNRL